MFALGTLAVSLAVLAAFVLAAIGALFGHGVWLRIERYRDRALIGPARDALFRAMREAASGTPTAEGRDPLAELRGLPMSLRLRLLVALAPSIDPSESTPLNRVARAVGVMARAEALCESRFWWRRLKGARLLALFGGGAGTRVRLLRDPHPAVRALAVEWAAADPTPESVEALVGFLTDPRQADLFTVQDALFRGGAAAVPPLARFLECGVGAGLEPALRIGAALADPRLVPPAIRLCSAADAGVRAAAAELLGATGGSDSTGVLADLLDDDDPVVRAAAARALGRLRFWRSAPRLADRMRDTAWPVRRSAGLALLAAGPPGQLMLRRMLGDSNSFAADMARQVLDLPAGVGEVRA